MPTREEMGNALWLCSWPEVPNAATLWDTHPNNLERHRYMEAAARFAAWLEVYHGTKPELAQDAFQRRLRRQIDGLPETIRHGSAVRCPKGHVLTHPEDIEKRYCGVCREFI